MVQPELMVWKYLMSLMSRESEENIIMESYVGK